MVKLIEIMLDEGLITKDAISKLVKSRPPKKISFANLIAEKMIDLEVVEEFLAKKVREGVITLSHLEKIEGIDIVPILKKVAQALHIEYVDLDDVEIDMKLFSEVPYKQLIKYNVIPVEETDLNVLIAFDDPQIGIAWPFAREAMKLSDKDTKQPLLKEADLFTYGEDLYA